MWWVAFEQFFVFFFEKLHLNVFICPFQGGDPYPWPMFSSYPLPHCYSLDPPNIHHNAQGKRNLDEVANINCCIIVIFSPIVFSHCTDAEISAFLASSKDSENEDSWMEICRRQYCKVMTSKHNIFTGKGKLLVHWVAADLPCNLDFLLSSIIMTT